MLSMERLLSLCCVRHLPSSRLLPGSEAVLI
jgi:hypothetical protein